MDKISNYYIFTYGCQMNSNDSERLAGQLQSVGYSPAEKPEAADVILVNTCCVRESAENKIYGKIGELKRLKRQNPDLIVGICGCMAQKDQEAILRRAPHVDIVLGTHNLHQLAELITKMNQARGSVVNVWDQAGQELHHVPVARKGDVTAYISIMYGCDNFCTYCIVPHVRGRERSRPLEDVISEVQEVVREGYKEVMLVGQNVNSYGKNLGIDFADLLYAVNEVKDLERIRFMTSHPRDISDKTIMAMRDCEKICEHLHLPIQAGDDDILKKMNRGYSSEYYAELVEKIRQYIPNISLTTDVIVGFPGETEEMFKNTLEILQKIRFDFAFTFLYSKRSGTPAATMAEQVPENVKKDRLARLSDLQNEISLSLNQQLEGQVVEILVEGPSKTNAATMTGRTRSNKIVIWDGNQAKSNELIQVKITKAKTFQLYGQQV